MFDTEIASILEEDERRKRLMYASFNPITGFGSIGDRVKVGISDFVLPEQWLPTSMARLPLIKSLAKFGSIESFLENELKVVPNEVDFGKVSQTIIRLRMRHDFAFWAASLVKIQNKSAGENVLFRLRYPQRLLVERFEKARLAGKPIRIILLKARQWGGSTTTQMYMAWLQFMHQRGLNSLIIAHQNSASDEIKDMFVTMMKEYPVEMLHQMGEPYSLNEPKMVGVGTSGSTQRIPQRNCKIKIGTAERPDGCRGGSYSLVHLSEVGLWKKTDGKSPSDIVRSACSGILLRPMTMIVMESTANGTGNFFHGEYKAAANPEVKSQYEPLFIPWFMIEQYSQPFSSEAERVGFARNLYLNRENPNVCSTREESGRYLWWLFEKGATLEAIHWYVEERAGRDSHAVMASEYPSDDEEAFVHSGTMVFDKYKVEKFRAGCRPPQFRGEISGAADEGLKALQGLKFEEDRQGMLSAWELPEEESDMRVTNRYLTVVDVGGRSAKADWSVIVVFDRLDMMDGENPKVVAQWYGHCDIDRLAWKAAQIAAYYNNSLLVIESNTLETHDRERQIEGGDQSLYILNQISCIYPNLYARRQSEDEIRQGVPRKYGFHTNVATKPMVISTLVKAVRERLWIERDSGCVDELLVYERKANGSYGAITGSHDDRLMTRAIGLHICFYEMDTPKIVPMSRPGQTRAKGNSFLEF